VINELMDVLIDVLVKFGSVLPLSETKLRDYALKHLNNQRQSIRKKASNVYALLVSVSKPEVAKASVEQILNNDHKPDSEGFKTRLLCISNLR
jgi:hypothetical protein